MSDEVRATAAHRFEQLKLLLAQYTGFGSDLPVIPQRGGDLGPAFVQCILEARFVFPGLSAQEQEQLALVRLAGMNILGRHLMTRLSDEGLARCGVRIDDRAELDRVTTDLEVDFVECKKQIVQRGIADRLTEVQKMFWEEWSNPLRAITSG